MIAAPDSGYRLRQSVSYLADCQAEAAAIPPSVNHYDAPCRLLQADGGRSYHIPASEQRMDHKRPLTPDLFSIHKKATPLSRRARISALLLLCLYLPRILRIASSVSITGR